MFLAQELPELPAYGFNNDLGSLLSLVITVLLPVLVGLVTKRSWSSSAKAVLLLLLATVNAFVTAWLESINTSAQFEIIPVIYTVVINFLIAVAVHFGLYRPTGITDAVQNTGIADSGHGTRRAV